MDTLYPTAPHKLALLVGKGVLDSFVSLVAAESAAAVGSTAGWVTHPPLRAQDPKLGGRGAEIRSVVEEDREAVDRGSVVVAIDTEGVVARLDLLRPLVLDSEFAANFVHRWSLLVAGLNHTAA